jgi:CTP synthase
MTTKVPWPSTSPQTQHDVKYLVVTGGTISGLGKGTAISSIGVVLKAMGLRVTAMKIDPYLNVDAGTMSPLEHGEVYVLDDGGEADLDLGNYERFLDLTLSSRHSLTSGKIYESVIKNERKGNYLGKTVQMVPHITDAIQNWIMGVGALPSDGSGQQPQVCLVELGGTVGDIESAVYTEALQQLQFRVGQENFLMAHVGFVPIIGATETGEQKTKPAQHGVKLLREAGIKPDIILCRSGRPIEAATRKKLSLFCQVPPEGIVSLHDLPNIFHVPLLLQEQGVGDLICKHFRLKPNDAPSPVLPLVCAALPSEALSTLLGDWRFLAERADKCQEEVTIAVVGKYTALEDAYTSVVKALKHASVEAGLDLTVNWVDSEDLEMNTKAKSPAKYDKAWSTVKTAGGVLVPGGFGSRGIEGKVLAAGYCRSNGKPYLGICVGLQTAVIEFARNAVGWPEANSTEFNESTPHPVVIFMPESSLEVMGGTMRLGSRATIVRDRESLGCKLYGGQHVVYERHRHRYEVNPAVVPAFEANGLRFSGQDDKGQRMEMCEIQEHPFFFACQYHPEYLSRPARPSPPFLGLLLAAGGHLQERLKVDGGFLRLGAGFDREPRSANQVSELDANCRRRTLSRNGSG